LVDTTAVILITYWFVENGLPLNPAVSDGVELAIFIATGYAVKVLIALVDTVPFYWGVAWLKVYLEFEPSHCGEKEAKQHGR
jgi:uncharacterized PurR-regulated membrane protein YhhQ (DUF165 family)